MSPIGLTIAGVGAATWGIYELVSKHLEAIEDFKNSVHVDMINLKKKEDEVTEKNRLALDNKYGFSAYVGALTEVEGLKDVIKDTDRTPFRDQENLQNVFKAYSHGRDTWGPIYDDIFTPAVAKLTGYDKEKFLNFVGGQHNVGGELMYNNSIQDAQRLMLLAETMRLGMSSDNAVSSIVNKNIADFDAWLALPKSERDKIDIKSKLQANRIDIARSQNGLNILSTPLSTLEGTDPTTTSAFWMGVKSKVDQLMQENGLMERVDAINGLSTDLKAYSDEWFKGVSALVGSMNVAIVGQEKDEKGNMVDKLNYLRISMTNDGRIDWGKLLGANIDSLHLQVSNGVQHHIEILRAIWEKIMSNDELKKFFPEGSYAKFLTQNIGNWGARDSSGALSNDIAQWEYDQYNRQGGPILPIDPKTATKEQKDMVRRYTIEQEAKKGKGTTSSTSSTTPTAPRIPKASDYKPDQSGYQNHYARTAARPTQIVFNIDKLCNFDKNEFLTADEKQIADVVVPRAVHAVTMALTTAQANLSAMTNNQG
jgi:hypothetical protein